MVDNESLDGPKAAVKLTQEITKQILTLSTGVLALSVTYINNLPPILMQYAFLLYISWFLFALAIIMGLITLSSIVHLLENNNYKPFEKVTTCPAMIQWISFIIGLISMTIFVIINVKSKV